MPYRHRRTSVSRVGKSRRFGTWVTAASFGSTALAAAARAEFDLLAGLEVAGASTVGATVARTHVRINVSGGASDTAPGFVWGLIKWDKTLLVNSPSPATDFYADWAWLNYVTPGTHGPILNTATTIFYSDAADVKAQRRLQEMNDTWVISLINEGNVSLNYNYFVRTFLKLP
jgi:hypothetical protein